jgi:predicted acetyltransferase
MTLEIVPAADADYATVYNLARFYLYDMAEHAGWDFPADGLFDAGDQFANYWGLPSRRAWPPAWRGFPFLIRIGGRPAGFALVKRLAEEPLTFDMGEFFIGRQHRRRGAGRRAATALFDRFAGRWEVREMLTNAAAQAFWRRIIGDYTGGDFTESREPFADYGDREFIVQRFRTLPKSRQGTVSV